MHVSTVSLSAKRLIDGSLFFLLDYNVYYKEILFHHHIYDTNSMLTTLVSELHYILVYPYFR